MMAQPVPVEPGGCIAVPLPTVFWYAHMVGGPLAEADGRVSV